MKKAVIPFIFLIVVVYSNVVSAGIGFKGGINLAKWSGAGLNNADDYSWKKGAILGSYYNYPINSYFSLQPGIFYSMKGWDYEFVGGNSNQYWSLNYIDISVLSKFTILTGDAFKPVILAGPYFGYLLNTKAGINSGDNSLSGDLPDDIFKSFETGLVFGLGFDFEGSAAAFTFEARYSLGLTQVMNMKGDIDNIGLPTSFNKNGTVRNQTFSIIGGVRF